MLSTHIHTQQLQTQTGALTFDEDGFLIDSDLWTKEAAQIIAELDGIGTLTEKHWKVIEYIRDRYFTIGGLPLMRRVCKANGLQKEEIKEMFGSCREIWRIAGLPHPGEEAKTYMS